MRTASAQEGAHSKAPRACVLAIAVLGSQFQAFSSFFVFKTAPESDFLANLSDAPSNGRKRDEPDDSTEEKDSEKDSQSLQVFAPLPFHTARAPSKAMDHQELVPLAFLLMSLLLRLPLLTLRAHGTI